MKKNSLSTFLLLGILIKSYCQPQIINPTFPSSVGLFDLFEVSFTMGQTYSNPYDPDVISIYAEFFSPDNSTQYTIDAFYYEDYTFQKITDGYDYYEDVLDSLNNVGWRIRFTPNCTGDWRFRIIAKDANGMTAQMPNNGSRFFFFNCTSVVNADGFISKANLRYLKRDVVRNGVRQFHSFFPIGPNIAWYDCLDYCVFNEPKGIYFYEEHIDSLYCNANFMRVWINRYHYLSLYGPEFTQFENGIPKVYFDSVVNQKDAAELDYIITYALQHDISIMLSIFNQNDFKTNDSGCNPCVWANNPFHTIMGLSSPCDFFTNHEAISVTKNLIRYIVSRWGYATNVLCWELWNEVDHVAKDYEEEDEEIYQKISVWHSIMAKYIREIDPYQHCISSSVAGVDDNPGYSSWFTYLDINQQHNYQNIQRIKTQFQPTYSIFLRTREGHNFYDTIPFFMGEFGYSLRHPPYANEKDPFGVSLHNTLWASLFSASIGPASFWWWDYLDSQGLYNRFAPLLNFCQNMPILSNTFKEYTTGKLHNGWVWFPNGLATHYMINTTEDTIMGWSQDTAFAYQSLRWLTDSIRWENDTLIYFNDDNNRYDTIFLYAYYFVDSVSYDTSGYIYTLDPVKRPQPSSNVNTITLPITNQPVGSRYMLRWYNSETGNAYNNGVYFVFVQMDNDGNKYVSFEFPSTIRNIQNHTVNNTYGDAVFVLRLFNSQNKRRQQR